MGPKAENYSCGENRTSEIYVPALVLLVCCYHLSDALIDGNQGQQETQTIIGKAIVSLIRRSLNFLGNNVDACFFFS